MISQNIRDIMVAIRSVEARFRAAEAEGRVLEANKLLQDLVNLDACLRIQTDHELKEQEKQGVSQNQ